MVADLDFTVTNPTFEALIGSSLSIAEKTAGTGGDAEATLTLGSNSTLDVVSASRRRVYGHATAPTRAPPAAS